MMTTILTIHVPSTPGRAWNMLVALQAGNIVARYAKLHLGNDSNLLIVFYVQIMPDDFVMQLHRF